MASIVNKLKELEIGSDYVIATFVVSNPQDGLDLVIRKTFPLHLGTASFDDPR